ncbi:MAG: macro domain-containing protein [Anaerostipes sp.]|jgi:O-acetyl-ADP-ribose deacetylase (regulator of RNase III)
MPFKIVRNDITKVKADAIVNTANPKPIFANGTDSAIYHAAGEKKLLAERKKIGDIEPGNVAVTPAFHLDAKYIIHTVGPVWVDGKRGEEQTLFSCYDKSLQKALELGCKSIAFPLISTGVYGFPKDLALQVAISVISSFLMKNDMLISLVVFDRKAFELSGNLFQGVDTFIDENYVREKKATEYSRRYGRNERGASNRRFRDVSEDEICRYQEEEEIQAYKYQLEQQSEPLADMNTPMPSMIGGNLDDLMNHVGETFQQRLLRLIDERGLTDTSVYKKANIDRKLFSKIRCNEDYKPKKKTAVALAIALELDIDDMKDLLARAEIALSPSNKFDLIIEYFISHKEYNVYKINLALFQHKQPILGE